MCILVQNNNKKSAWGSDPAARITIACSGTWMPWVATIRSSDSDSAAARPRGFGIPVCVQRWYDDAGTAGRHRAQSARQHAARVLDLEWLWKMRKKKNSFGWMQLIFTLQCLHFCFVKIFFSIGGKVSILTQGGWYCISKWKTWPYLEFTLT